jgi:hypothetical protein
MLEQAIRAELDTLELFVEDLWYRRLSKHALPWWEGYPKLDHFFWAGLLPMPGFNKGFHPPRQFYIHSNNGSMQASPWAIFAMWNSLRKRRRELRRFTETARRMLLTWACMKLGVGSKDTVSIRIRSLDVRTLWAARQLELGLGWKPLLETDDPKSRWLGWGKATGSEPVLDLSGEISLSGSAIRQ